MLLVDGDEEFLAALAVSLSSRPGIDVLCTARTALEAVDLVRSLAPDVVVMGAGPAEGASFEAIRAIKGTPDAPIVVVLTARGDDQVRLKALAVGADGFAAKDEPGDHLFALLDRILAHLHPRPVRSFPKPDRPA